MFNSLLIRLIMMVVMFVSLIIAGCSDAQNTSSRKRASIDNENSGDAYENTDDDVDNDDDNEDNDEDEDEDEDEEDTNGLLDMLGNVSGLGGIFGILGKLKPDALQSVLDNPAFADILKSKGGGMLKVDTLKSMVEKAGGTLPAILGNAENLDPTKLLELLKTLRPPNP